jgi:hypothetical protein
VAFSASSAIFEEEVAKIIDAMVAGDSWEQSLVSFARFPPVSGEPEKNRELIKQRHAAYPLQALFPTQLLGPDGLPAYTGTSAEDRFEVEVVRWETDLIKGWLPLLVQGLHELPRRHPTPSAQDLHGFLQQWPGFAYDLPGASRCASTLVGWRRRRRHLYRVATDRTHRPCVGHEPTARNLPSPGEAHPRPNSRATGIATDPERDAPSSRGADPAL